MLAKKGDSPVKGARCMSCQLEQEVLNCDHPGDITTSEHEVCFIGYVCQNEYCKLHGIVVRTFRPALEAPIPVEHKPPEKKK